MQVWFAMRLGSAETRWLAEAISVLLMTQDS
jgi:hypothetical protein